MEDCIKLFTVLGYNIKSKNDLLDLTIPREKLLDNTLLKDIQNAISDVSKKYKSSKLTCLHKNSTNKQKFPIINFIRQVLKCNNLYLKPLVLCRGYNKSNGKKIIDRYFKIININDINYINQIIDEKSDLTDEKVL